MEIPRDAAAAAVLAPLARRWRTSSSRGVRGSVAVAGSMRSESSRRWSSLDENRTSPAAAARTAPTTSLKPRSFVRWPAAPDRAAVSEQEAVRIMQGAVARGEIDPAVVAALGAQVRTGTSLEVEQ